MSGSRGGQPIDANDSMKEMPSSGGTRRLASRLWIILGLALVLLLLFLLVPRGPAPITGRRVFGGVLIVSPPQPGDRHRISEGQARTVLDNQGFSDYSKQPRLILFGFGRFTAPSLNVTSPVV